MPETQDNLTLGKDPLYEVGYRVLDFKYPEEDTEKTMAVAVWYPTEQTANPYLYGGVMEGAAALDAPLAEGARHCPFFAFSHAYSGGGVAYIYLTEALARRGWVVIAPDFPDKHQMIRIRGTGTYSKRAVGEMMQEQQVFLRFADWEESFKYRPRLLGMAIEGVLASEFFEGKIDQTQLSVGGHSLGGYTALARCGFGQFAKDKRIRAALLLSGGAKIFPNQEFEKLRIPTMYMYGELENDGTQHTVGNQIIRGEAHRTAYEHSLSPSYLLEIREANHFSFNNTHRLLGRQEEQIQERMDIIQKYSVAFLEWHVCGNKNFKDFLQETHKGISQFSHK